MIDQSLPHRRLKRIHAEIDFLLQRAGAADCSDAEWAWINKRAIELKEQEQRAMHEALGLPE